MMKKLIVVDKIDNVGLCKDKVKINEHIDVGCDELVALNDIGIGQRVAIEDILEGKELFQYGCPFAISKGIKRGEGVTRSNTTEKIIESSINFTEIKKNFSEEKSQIRTEFMGYKREDGKVGTRNYYLVMPLSECASETAVQIANMASVQAKPNEYDNVDGIIAIPNTEGCGCAANIQIDRFLTILINYIKHPNVGRVLVVDLGCEQTNIKKLIACLNSEGNGIEKIDFISIQGEGGTKIAIDKGSGLILNNLPLLNKCFRTKCDLSDIIMGTECGASDAFSGISANYLIGKAVDEIISQGGCAILSEVPEMVGAERLLLKRMKNENVAEKFIKIMNWYENLAKLLGKDLKDNLVPENIAGGLINNCIKSLGAIIKGGSTTVVDVLEYGECVKEVGLSLMQGPGNDLESVTGISSGGANLILFSTGKGTVTGAAITPVIKISSTSEMFNKMKNNMDFDAGILISPDRSKFEESVKEELLDLIIKVASGVETKAEINNQRQFQVWTAGKIPL